LPGQSAGGASAGAPPPPAPPPVGGSGAAPPGMMCYVDVSSLSSSIDKLDCVHVDSLSLSLSLSLSASVSLTYTAPPPPPAGGSGSGSSGGGFLDQLQSAKLKAAAPEESTVDLSSVDDITRNSLASTLAMAMKDRYITN
jgi:hypothetical protein